MIDHNIAQKEQREQKARVKAQATVVDLVTLMAMTTDIEIMALGGTDNAIKALRDHLLTQAEITWPIAKRAGKREAQDGIWDKVMGAKKSGFDEGKQEGIREVVEWIDSLPDWGGVNRETEEYFVKGKLIPISELQVFKKSKGVE